MAAISASMESGDLYYISDERPKATREYHETAIAAHKKARCYMAFDLDKLYSFCVDEIERFAAKHRDETFYAFAVDASLLCLNSEEQYQRIRAKSQANWERQTRHIERWEELTEQDRSEIRWLLDMAARLDGLDLTDKNACLAVINDERERQRKDDSQNKLDAEKVFRNNPGDWAYQGFAEMTDQVGFDDRAYQEHYGMSDQDQRTSEYGLAMDALVERLKSGGVFDCLKMSTRFYATRVEHDY